MKTTGYFKQSDLVVTRHIFLDIPLKNVFQLKSSYFLRWTRNWTRKRSRTTPKSPDQGLGPETPDLDPLELLDAKKVRDSVHCHCVHQVVSDQLSD